MWGWSSKYYHGRFHRCLVPWCLDPGKCRWMSDSSGSSTDGEIFKNTLLGCPVFMTLLPEEADHKAKKKQRKYVPYWGVRGSDRFTIVSHRWVNYNLFRGRNQPTYIGVKGHLVTKYQQDIPAIFQSYLLRWTIFWVGLFLEAQIFPHVGSVFGSLKIYSLNRGSQVILSPAWGHGHFINHWEMGRVLAVPHVCPTS